MKTMKALRFEKYGPPSVLTLEELGVPELRPGQALVEVRASAVNPSDVKNVAGAFHSPLARVPGRDYAGVVAIGDGWTGKEVWGSGPGLGATQDGTHAQYVIVDLDSLSEKPAQLSMSEAAAVGIPYLTAWAALVDAAQIQAGETLLVTGAVGAVGQAAIQIAHWKEARVIGADILDNPSDADAFINAKNKDLTVETRAWTTGKGVDLAFDCVGGPMFESCLKSLRMGGRQVAITSLGDGRVAFNLRDFYHNRLRLIGVDSMGFTGPQIATIMDSLRPGFESRHLRPPSVQTWSLERAVDAYAAVQAGASGKKHVLVPTL
ncbi:MAG: zinc-binding alcohol dehydrogenase family protein [Polyangiaceae bacterium]|jgi:NADPH:quinone reductase-like Zn-dependent oxidoreductase